MTYPHLFEPIDVGTMQLRNRVMLPPHASAIGNIWGTEDEARRNIAYFERRCADDGVAWVGSLSTHLRNTVVPGFEPTGVGAATLGHFRLPYFVERVQQFTDSLHALGTAVTVQMVHQGGMPHAPSAVMSAPTINLVPHVMTSSEIAWFVREYADSARLAQEGRADIALRVAVQPGGCSGLRYAMFLDDEVSDKDVTEEQHGVRLVVDKMSVPYLDLATIDFLDSLEQSGFTIDNPMAQGSCACGHSFH